MYMQNDIVAAAIKGPHIDAPRIDPAVRQAEIDYILTTANAALPKAVLKKLGGLSLARASQDNDNAYFAQIRSEPIGPSGVEFRYPIPARATGEGGLDGHVANIVEAAVGVAKPSRAMRDWTDAMRQIGQEAIQPATGGIWPMRAVAVGATPIYAQGRMDVTIDVEMLGCDLSVGIERATAHGPDEIEVKLAKLVETHLLRSRTLAQAKVAGATGWIDEAALNIIDVAGLDRAEILTLVRDRHDVEFSFGGEEGYDVSGALYWVDGVITGFAERRTKAGLYRLGGKTLTIETRGLPATIISSMLGRRLREVVDLEIIPESALIVDINEADDLLYLELEIARRPIEEEFPAARAS